MSAVDAAPPAQVADVARRSTFRTSILSTIEDVSAMAGEWRDLLRSTGCTHPFVSPDWLLTWFEQFGARRRPFVMTVRDDHARLVGLAPLSIETVHVGGIAVRRLCFLGDRAVGSDHLCVLVEPDVMAPVMSSLAEAIRSRSRDWDYVELQDATPNSALDQLSAELARHGAHRVRPAASCPYAPLPSAFETYFAALGSNLRAKLRRMGRRLEERGTVEWGEYTTPPEIDAAYESLVALHRRRFADRDETSAFANDAAQAFHRVVLGRLAALGWVRVFVLRIDGQPIAALMGYQVRDKFLFYQAGMDPTWSDMRPGQLLMAHTIDRAIQLGCVEYDFLRGLEEYKQMWATQVRHTVTHIVYGRGWRALLTRCAHDVRKRAVALKRRVDQDRKGPIPSKGSQS